MDAPAESVQVQARWLLDPADVPVLANQVLIQLGPPAGGQPDGVYLNFGHLNPPVVDGPPGTRLSQDMVAGQVFPVVPVARVAMSVDKLIEMRQAIDNLLNAMGGDAQ